VTSAGPILVTGAAGFIGSSLTDRLLKDGVGVIGLDNFCDFYDPARKRANIEAAMAHPRFQLVEADIRDRAAVLEAFATHRPAAVVHLAAMAGVRPSIEHPDYYAAVNVSGTVNLLDAAVAHGVQRFLFASSSSVYGNNPKVPFAETDSVDHPISPYAATKKAGELICYTYHHLHALPVFCLRFFTVFGPRQRPDLAISKFLRLVAAGKRIPVFGDGSASRDYTYIDDIVSGILATLDRCGTVGTTTGGSGDQSSGGGYRIYNLGGSHPVSLKDLIATIEKVVGRTAVLDRLPMQPGDVERTWADLTRSSAELGYHPRTSLGEGIARQWAWMKSCSTT
jgi:UDP-glucuronate 4-epimerase